MQHHGRIAIVTGASRGIGQAIALRLAADGARVANLDIASGDETEQLASQSGQRILSCACDLAEPDQIRSAVQFVTQQFGAPPSIVVHAAAFQFLKPIEEISTDEWRKVQAINQEAAFHLTQASLPGMRQAQWGRIILVVSSTFWVGGVTMSHYVASKGALIGFAHGLAAEIGQYGVTINCVAPGLTMTATAAASLPAHFFEHIASVQSIKRNGRPEDQAGVVSFLASDDAAFMTGQTLVVDGGQART